MPDSLPPGLVHLKVHLVKNPEFQNIFVFFFLSLKTASLLCNIKLFNKFTIQQYLLENLWLKVRRWLNSIKW